MKKTVKFFFINLLLSITATAFADFSVTTPFSPSFTLDNRTPISIGYTPYIVNNNIASQQLIPLNPKNIIWINRFRKQTFAMPGNSTPITVYAFLQNRGIIIICPHITNIRSRTYITVTGNDSMGYNCSF